MKNISFVYIDKLTEDYAEYQFGGQERTHTFYFSRKQPIEILDKLKQGEYFLVHRANVDSDNRTFVWIAAENVTKQYRDLMKWARSHTLVTSFIHYVQVLAS